MPELDVLHKLEQTTGISHNEIPLNEKRVLDVFLQDGFSFIPRNKALQEKVQDIEGRIISLTKPQSFSDLARISGISNGSGTWENNAEELLREGMPLNEMISSRDDIISFLTGKGLDRKQSFVIMRSVSRGKGITEEMERDMLSFGVPEWYIGSCRKIRYLFPKAHIMDYMKLYCKFAYYKVYANCGR